MGKRMRRRTGLTALFWRYLLVTGGAVVLLAVLWWGGLSALLRSGFVLPAGTAAGQADGLVRALEAGELTPAELWAGRQTRGEGSPLRLAYLDRLLRQTERAIAGLKRSKRPEDASRLAELEQVHQGLLDTKEEWLSWQR